VRALLRSFDGSNSRGEKMTAATLTKSTDPHANRDLSVPAEPRLQADASPGTDKKQNTDRAATNRRFPIWFVGVGLGVALIAGYLTIPRLYIQTTDDAYIQADVVSVVPKVAGYVTALHVDDNSRFRANELLVEIDPRDFEAAVKIADANLLSAQAAKANVEQQLAQQAHVIAAAQATIESDRATLEFSKQQLQRYTDLADRGSGTVQNEQQAVSDFGQRKAALEHDGASLSAAQAQADVLKSQAQQADATIDLQEATLAQAKLNLSYTKIYATTDGTVANRTVQVGNFVQPGQALFAAVPTDVFVIANFKETQIERMQVGQPVRVRVDALPSAHLQGHIDSFQRGTGSNFALLPPENATGNFVKVVQRIPVKIILDGPADALRLISPGMSVEPTVTTTPPPIWLKPLLRLAGDPA
jgi:membrane fusion protein, multidrug efflux system